MTLSDHLKQNSLCRIIKKPIIQPDNNEKLSGCSFSYGNILKKLRIFYGAYLTSSPAACETIGSFLELTGTKPEDYDLILTGDLGEVGTNILYELMIKEHGIDISSVHGDCGLMIYDRDSQDVHAGGSGCGCSASVLCSKIMQELSAGKIKNVLFTATGALLSPVRTLQGESIPGIAHGILFTGGKNGYLS